MKIVHLISSLRRAGAELVLCTLVKELQKRGYEQTVWYIHDGPMRHELEQHGIPTKQIRALFFRYDPLFWFRAWHFFHQSNVQLVISHLWMANLVARLGGWLTGKKVVSVIHQPLDHQGALRTIIDRITFGKVQQLVSVSDSITASLAKRRWVPQQRVLQISNGIDSSWVRAQTKGEQLSRASFNSAKETFVVGAVGRLVPVKQFNILIDAVAYLRRKRDDVHCIIVGAGVQEQCLKEQVNILGINDAVHFITDASVAYPYYPLFDCFVQPSKAEGLSMALLEAICFDIPVIVTGDRGQHQLVEHERSGLVIPPNVSALVEAVEKYYDVQNRKMYAARAREHIEKNYSLERMVNQYECILRHRVDGDARCVK